MPRRRVWIAEVLFRPEVAHKIETKHRVTPRDVEEAVRFYAHREARWHNHRLYSRRLIVRGKTFDQVPLIVYLAPVNEADGIWECRTARRER